jgi:homoserine kinase type II
MAPISAETSAMVQEVLARFDISGATVRDVRTGRVNKHWRIDSDAGARVLRRYLRWRTPSAVHYEHAVLDHLATRNWPVAVPLPSAAGERVVSVEGRLYSLFPFLPGKPGPTTSARQARLKGRLLARLHQDLAAWDAPGQREGFGRIWELDVYVAAHSRNATLNEALMAFGADHPDLARAVRAQKYAMLRELSTLGYGELPVTLGHFDFHRDNLLFERGQLTGLLDLDFVHLDARVADIATCLASDCLAPPAYNEVDPAAVRAFVGGYVEHAPLADAEVQVVVPLMRAFIVWLCAWRLAHWGEGATDDSPVRSIRRSVTARFPSLDRVRPQLEAAVLQAAAERSNR